jgi:hypothetical protein
MIAVLRSQISPKGEKQYFTIIDGKSTIVNGLGNDIIIAKIQITKDLGRIQFAKIIEILEILPISKLEIIQAVRDSENYSLRSWGHFDIVDEIYKHETIENVVNMQVSVVGASRDVAILKTKYGISIFNFAWVEGSFKHQSFNRYNVKPLFTIHHSEYGYKTKEDWLKR